MECIPRPRVNNTPPDLDLTSSFGSAVTDPCEHQEHLVQHRRSEHHRLCQSQGGRLYNKGETVSGCKQGRPQVLYDEIQKISRGHAPVRVPVTRPSGLKCSTSVSESYRSPVSARPKTLNK